ncbi:MAG: methyltransferase [Actinomycetia bacterium]|nr:methyltransferase [Actinomycetes bacterium]
MRSSEQSEATELPDTPVGRQVRWLLEAWSSGRVSDAEVGERFAPGFSFDRFSSGDGLVDPGPRRAWLEQGRRTQPRPVQVASDTPLQLAVEVAGRDDCRTWHGFRVEDAPPHRLSVHCSMSPMPEDGVARASATMQVGAVGRAAHLVDDPPHVFVDEIARQLLTPEHREHLPTRPRRGPTYLTALVRARLAEDVVEQAYADGCRQYVVLGAGLDSFAYRRHDLPGLHVFEVDEPVSQDWKRTRLAEVGITEPEHLSFVPVDFDTQRLDERLVANGFDPDRPAVFSMLGVTGYITKDAFEHTLDLVGATSGNELAFDYHCRSLETDFDRLLLAVVRAAGEPNDTAYEPDEVMVLLARRGLVVVCDLDPDGATQRYLDGRADGLAVKGMTRLVHARRPA